MNSLTQALALAAALALGQTNPEPDVAAPAAEPSARPVAEPAKPLAEPPAEPKEPAPAPDAEAAPEPVAPAAPPARRTERASPSPGQAPTVPGPASPSPSPPRAPPSPAAASTAVKTPPTSEREQVARAALAFLDALVRGDADALAAACGERFSFDGDVRSGSSVRSGWREVLARRPGPARLLDLEVLSAADAATRFGPPPPRLAPLARGWVAVANVSGRPIVLFVAREGGRFAVVGMQG